jgi:dTDP-4-amino-4,6-dideoxygalactose transaminase
VTIPLFDPHTPLEPLRDAVLERVADVIRSGRYVLGPELEAFERELASPPSHAQL